MKTYNVKLQRTFERNAEVQGVQARNADEAIEKAILIADAPDSALWLEGERIGESSKAKSVPR